MSVSQFLAKMHPGKTMVEVLTEQMYVDATQLQ